MRKSKLHYWALLMVLIVLDISTVCVIGEIYINYASASKVTKVTTLKKWGVNIEAPSTSRLVQSLGRDNSLTVDAVDETDLIKTIVAPGAEHTFENFSLSGTTTVKVEVTNNICVTVDKDNIDNWKISYEDGGVEKVYFPLVFTIADNEYYFNDDYTDSDGNYILKSKAEDEYTYTSTRSYAKGTDLSKVDFENVMCKWDYYKDSEHDDYDTQLGNYDDIEKDAPIFKVTSTIIVNWDDATKKTTGSSSESSEESSSTTSSEPTTKEPQAISGTNTLLPNTRGGAIYDDNGLTGIQTLTGIVSTGDDFNAVLWISLMVIAAVVITVLIVLIVKRKKKDEADKSKK